MLLALDVHIEGQVREKLLVAYFRYSGKYNFKVYLEKKTSFQTTSSLRAACSELEKDLVVFKENKN